MLIDLSKSKLFTSDPGVRFAREYGIPEEAWKELWRRYKVVVNTVVFGDLEQLVIDELTRSMRNGKSGNSKVII